VSSPLLERASELELLLAAAERTTDAHGSTVLISGEPGVGKTTLVQALVSALPPRTRVLQGGCEALLTPRALGALRDAATSTAGPLAAALRDCRDQDQLLSAVIEELRDGPAPTVLVIEDAHWADGATTDVIHHLGRRIQDLPALLVVTYRDGDLAADHPLRAVLGDLPPGSTSRLRPSGLSATAVGRLASGVDVDVDELMTLTGGNPFYVTEVLAAPDEQVPATVADAVLARMSRLPPQTRAALEPLAVVPAGLDLGAIAELGTDLDAVRAAELAGVVTLRGDVLRFRHELARRAVAAALPASVRLAWHTAVLRLLEGRPGADPFVLLHHAVRAGDRQASITYGVAAAQEANRVGAHRQAVECYERVLAHPEGLPLTQRAALSEAYVWSLTNLNKLREAARVAGTAVELWRRVGTDPKLVRALVALSRQQWLNEATEAALSTAVDALDLARQQQDETALALATLNLGGALVCVDREEEGLPLLAESLRDFERLGLQHWAALALDYLGSGHLQLGGLEGEAELWRSMELAREVGNHEYVMRGYYNLAEGLWRLGRYSDVLRVIDAGEDYARDRDFPVHAYMFRARRLRRRAMCGELRATAQGLSEMLDGHEDPGMIGRETIPILARQLVRLGDPSAERWLVATADHARRTGVLEWTVPSGLAWMEHAWLEGDPGLAEDWPAVLDAATDRPGTAVQRGEVLRFRRRLGHAVAPFPGCPAAYAAGITGDWKTAAAAWRDEGDPYQEALELIESSDPADVVTALHTLNGLGAVPAATLARRRLRELGVRQIPRRRSPDRLRNPAGLTDRQMEILRLVADGLSNAEIAQRLVISTRTVDHHVSAILQALGVATRRRAAERLAALEPTDRGPGEPLG
jgi:DNA-binding CsgD family transcriptional regulator/tetratricopeptide (TPR) repeat protein